MRTMFVLVFVFGLHSIKAQHLKEVSYRVSEKDPEMHLICSNMDQAMLEMEGALTTSKINVVLLSFLNATAQSPDNEVQLLAPFVPSEVESFHFTSGDLSRDEAFEALNIFLAHSAGEVVKVYRTSDRKPWEDVPLHIMTWHIDHEDNTAQVSMHFVLKEGQYYLSAMSLNYLYHKGKEHFSQITRFDRARP